MDGKSGHIDAEGIDYVPGRIHRQYETIAVTDDLLDYASECGTVESPEDVPSYLLDMLVTTIREDVETYRLERDFREIDTLSGTTVKDIHDLYHDQAENVETNDEAAMYALGCAVGILEGIESSRDDPRRGTDRFRYK